MTVSSAAILSALNASNSIVEAAERLGVSRQAVMERCKDGVLSLAYAACHARGEARVGRRILRDDAAIMRVLAAAPSCKEASRILGYAPKGLRVRCRKGKLLEAYEACREKGDRLRGVKWRTAS